MYRTLVPTAIALVAIGTPLPTLAGELPPEYKNTPTAADYPNADVLALSDTVVYTLHPDGRVDQHVTRVEKVLTFHGMDEIGELFVAYNPKLQKLNILKSRTHTPEGNVVDTQANGFTEMTPFALEKAPDYTDWRQMVITHVGLDVDAVVETEYRIEDSSRWRQFLEGSEVLWKAEPAAQRKVVVEVPLETNLNHHLVNFEGAPEVTQTDKQKIYTWTFKNLPNNQHQHLSARERALLPALYFTTAPDWGVWSDIQGKRIDEAIAASSPALKQKVTSLLEDVHGDLDRAIALHAFVAESLNSVEWPLYAYDYKPRGASATLESSYGHGLDKAVLLAAMLRQAGFEANVALTAPNPSQDAALHTLPCLLRLEQAIVRVDFDQTVLWLDPDAPLAEHSQRDFIGYEGLPMIRGMNELHVMTAPGTPNQMDINLRVKIAADFSMTGEGRLELAGYYSPYFRVRADEKALRGALDGLLDALVPGATLSESHVTAMEPFHTAFEVKFNVSKPEDGAQPAILKTQPAPGSVLLEVQDLYLRKRMLPLLLSSTGTEKVVITYALPDGKTPRYLPASLSSTSPAGRVTRDWLLEKNDLIMRSEVSLTETRVGVDDYATFKDMVGRFMAENGLFVLF